MFPFLTRMVSDRKNKMRNKLITRFIKGGIVTILSAIVLFFAFSWVAEYRPEECEITLYDKIRPEYLPDTLTVVSWNIGYAGLGDNMDFFYDGGHRVRDSKERTAYNLEEIIRTLKEINADLILLQEVDLNSHRSYGIREVDSLQKAFSEYHLSFAYNYKVRWVPIPLKNPIGRVNSGVVTLSRVGPFKTERIQYPSAFSFPVRLFNLKRCLLSSYFLTVSGDTLIVNNTHNTAYDTGGMRDTEMNFLANELNSGLTPYTQILTGGDWNQYPPDYTPSEEELSNEYFVPQKVDETLFGEKFRFVFDARTPSLRYLDHVWAGNNNESRPCTTLTDFFLLSSPLKILSVETLPLGFRSSDHNPVLLRIAMPDHKNGSPEKPIQK